MDWDPSHLDAYLEIGTCAGAVGAGSGWLLCRFPNSISRFSRTRNCHTDCKR